MADWWPFWKSKIFHPFAFGTVGTQIDRVLIYFQMAPLFFGSDPKWPPDNRFECSQNTFPIISPWHWKVKVKLSWPGLLYWKWNWNCPPRPHVFPVLKLKLSWFCHLLLPVAIQGSWCLKNNDVRNIWISRVFVHVTHGLDLVIQSMLSGCYLVVWNKGLIWTVVLCSQQDTCAIQQTSSYNTCIWSVPGRWCTSFWNFDFFHNGRLVAIFDVLAFSTVTRKRY